MKFTKTMGRYALAAAMGAALSPFAKIPLARAADPAPMTAGILNAGTMPMAQAQVSGTIINRYVDARGNVTAVDLQTTSGVKMVRWTPPIAAGDSRLNDLIAGHSTTLTGVVTAGVGSYSPDAGAHSSIMYLGLPMSNVKGTYPFDVSIDDLMNRLVTMNVTAASPTPGSFKSLVTLTDGRVTVVKSIDGRSYYVDPDDGRMIEVTGTEADVAMKPLRHRAGRGARITTLSADGTMAVPMSDTAAKPM